MRTLRKPHILGPSVIDLALIDVVEDPSDDHIAALSFDSFAGTSGSLVLLGFGCDSFAERSTMTLRLKKGVLKNFVPRKAMWRFEGNDASGCPGDSGSPLLWQANGKTSVVGVNSFGLAPNGTAADAAQGSKTFAVSFSRTEGGAEAARWLTEQLGL